MICGAARILTLTPPSSCIITENECGAARILTLTPPSRHITTENDHVELRAFSHLLHHHAVL